MMPGHILEQGIEQPDFQWAMIRNADMVLSPALGGELNVRTGLSLDFVS